MKRRVEPELLNTVPREEAAANLRDLVRINRWLGGHRLLPRLIKSVASPDEALLVLDVGAASGDMGAAVRKRFPRATVVSLDHSATNLAAAPPPKAVADAFALPFAAASFDVVTACLFVHHFEAERAVAALKEMHRVARRAVVVLDLWRHPAPMWFLPATRLLFGWQRLTVYDGTRSVAAGFQAGELRRLAARAGFEQVRVRRHLPWFRISLVARVDGGNLLR